LTPPDFVTFTTDQLTTLGVLALNLGFIGWIFVGVRRNNRDLSDIKSSLKRIIQAMQPTNIPDIIAPQVNTTSDADLPLRAETINGPQSGSTPNIEAFIAARKAGISLQEAARQYDLTEDEAFAISISYRDAAPSPVNNDAMP